MDLTHWVFDLTVFPRRLLSSGLKMSSATLTSEMLTRQLVSRFLPMIRLSVFMESHLMMHWISLANLACKYNKRV